MTANKGFGPPKSPKKVSKVSDRRAAAAQQLDEMKAKGLPEYEIYLRVRGSNAWLPVGAIAVKRSDQINAAIFANEEELQKGAFRLFPRLKKQTLGFEYGYRLKEFPDEAIKLAEKPAPGLAAPLQEIVAQVRQRVGKFIQR